MGALASAVRQGKALYVGISSYGPARTREAAHLLRDMGVPALIHQPSYSMINRWVEDEGLLDILEEEGMGCIGFVPLAQGLLTDKYLGGIPTNSRAAQGKSLNPQLINDDTIARLRALNDIAARRGQSLAQLALAWVLRDPRVTSALIGVSNVAQLEANVAALQAPQLTPGELAEIDQHVIEPEGVNLWSVSSDA
jgi:L-glyceraldehyde 3-phosphate reductase